MSRTANWREQRQAFAAFLEDKIFPVEAVLHGSDATARTRVISELKEQAKSAGLWAIGHPTDIGGQGMPFLEYVYMNEVIGKSHYAQNIFGTLSLQDSLMLREFASGELKERYLGGLVSGAIYPSFAMTEPGIAGSDPTQLQSSAVLDGDQWVINGHKWFTTGAADAAYTTVMVRTEADVEGHGAFSMIIVPTDTPGYDIVRDTPVLGMDSGHYEVRYNNVRVPASNLLGNRGEGFVIAQKRLGPGRIFHCMRWLGQAQRAFDLMCRRMHQRGAFGSALADKQLLQQHVFNSLAEIQAARKLTLDAAARIDTGDSARIEIGMIKVVGATMLQNVIDRAIQVYGAEGLTDDTPLSFMYRHAREARIYDGPDEVHIQSVARQVLRRFKDPDFAWDFSEFDT